MMAFLFDDSDQHDEPNDRHHRKIETEAFRKNNAPTLADSNVSSIVSDARSLPLGFGHIHAAVLGLPVVQSGFRDAVLARQLGGLCPSLVLAQNRDESALP
jgi:hypothetical protein